MVTNLQSIPASQPRPPAHARAGRTLAETNKALQMLRDLRCGNCKKLLARVGDPVHIQIKCSRCRALNHEKTKSLDAPPLSDSMRPVPHNC